MIELLLRVIHDPALDGATNMARDEALLLGAGDGNRVPTLRTYQWSPPSLSLGYFQKYADFEALPPPAGRLPVVRRLTGGGAILHDLELTYSLTVPLSHPVAIGSVEWLYELAHDAIIECLASRGAAAHRGADSDGFGAARGPFFCFARRSPLDVLHAKGKIAGSAQRRTRQAVLQHGSIIFAVRYPQQPAGAVQDMLPLTPDQLRDEFADGFARRAKLNPEMGGWASRELDVAAGLIPKYAGAEWTRRR